MTFHLRLKRIIKPKHARLKFDLEKLKDPNVLETFHAMIGGKFANCSGMVMSPVLQGTVKGGRRQGRQRKRWEDNIREWTGLEFPKSQRAVENRKRWGKLLAKSSVVPH